MSRILKALATIEAKGPTLSLPREDSARTPRRREGDAAQRAGLSLAALESYLQAALAIEQRLLGTSETDSVVLLCASGRGEPVFDAYAWRIASSFPSFENVEVELAVLEGDARPSVVVVDREVACAIENDECARRFESPDTSAVDWTVLPASDITDEWSIAPAALPDRVWERPADLPGGHETQPPEPTELPPDFFDAWSCAATPERFAWAREEFSLPAPADIAYVVEAPRLPGWPELVPIAPQTCDASNVDLSSLVAETDVPGGRCEVIDVVPAAAVDLYAIEPPDWESIYDAVRRARLQPRRDLVPLAGPSPSRPTVAASIPAAKLRDVATTVASTKSPVSATPPPQSTIARPTLTSRQLLPDDTAWHECRQIADQILADTTGPKEQIVLLVPLEFASTSTFAPLAAMLAEASKRRVLWVDTASMPADLRDFCGNANGGFRDVLAAPSRWTEFVTETAIPRLDLLPSGTPGRPAHNPKEKWRAAAWFDAVREAYPLTVIHASFRRGALLTELVTAADATYVVAPLGDTRCDAVQEAISQLQVWGARVRGCIVTEFAEGISAGAGAL